VVVVFHPIADPFPGFLEGLEPRPLQELLFHRLPEPLDLPQRHRMMRSAADVVDVVFRQFLLELRPAPPTGVLPAVVGEHLSGRPVFRHGPAVDLHHVFAGLAAVHPEPRDVPGVVIEESDDVGRLAQDRKVRDVALPHLVRRGTLEPPGRRLRLLARLGFGRRKSRRIQVPAYRLRTGLQKEKPPQNLRYPLRPLPRFFPFQCRDLVTDRPRQLRGARPALDGSQSRLAVLPVTFDPSTNRLAGDSQFLGHQSRGDPFFQVQLHGAPPHFVGIWRRPKRLAFDSTPRRRDSHPQRRGAPPSPPRGARSALPLSP